MNSSTILAGIILFILIGCSTEQNGIIESASSTPPGFIIEQASEGNPQLEDYLNFLNGSYDGSLHLQNNASYRFKNEETGELFDITSSSNLSTQFTSESSACESNVQFGPFNLICKSDGYYCVNYQERGNLVANLYGASSEFSIDNARSGENLTASIYVPQVVSVTSFSPSTKQIAPGTSISWVTDPSFSKGLIMILDYRPSNLAGTEEERQLYPDRVSYAKIIPDNGSYTFTAADLENFSEGMTIELLLTRGTYAVYQSEVTNQTYGLAAYSTFHHNFAY
ncbi:MAG: hypothetical protein AAFW00_18905 [Bacteroidota bacterium]